MKRKVWLLVAIIVAMLGMTACGGSVQETSSGIDPAFKAAIDENELTEEEALYYAEVNLRIYQKLLEVQ